MRELHYESSNQESTPATNKAGLVMIHEDPKYRERRCWKGITPLEARVEPKVPVRSAMP